MADTTTDAGRTSIAPITGRGFMARVVCDVAGRRGAQLGLAWIGLLVIFAVFAPFLANSHPLLWKTEGTLSSPLLKQLTPTDVTLLIAFFAGVVLSLVSRIATPSRMAAWVWIVAWTIPFAAHREVWRWLHVPGESSWQRWVAVVTALLVVAAVVLVLPLTTRASMKFRATVGAVEIAIAVLLVVFPIQIPAAQVLSQYREARAEGQVEWAVYTPIPYSPNDRQRDRLARENVDPRLLPPGRDHLMGTTDEGADLASRMIHASRIALAIGLIATGIAVFIGVVVGAMMGYFSGWIDLIGMRLVEIFSAIPVIFLLIMIVAFYGRSLYLMMIIIGLTGWVGYAVYIRAEFLKLRNMDYVQSARAIGAPLWSILFRHILPNGITPVLVLASFGIASAILTESTLSFLGLGLVEEPSWGQMLNQARAAGSHWGLVIFPGMAIFLTVFAYNLVGEALRDAIDPHTQRATHM